LRRIERKERGKRKKSRHTPPPMVRRATPPEDLTSHLWMVGVGSHTCHQNTTVSLYMLVRVTHSS